MLFLKVEKLSFKVFTTDNLPVPQRIKMSLYKIGVPKRENKLLNLN